MSKWENVYQELPENFQMTLCGINQFELFVLKNDEKESLHPQNEWFLVI